MITLKFEWYLHDSDYVDNKDDSTKVTEIVEAHRDLCIGPLLLSQ